MVDFLHHRGPLLESLTAIRVAPDWSYRLSRSFLSEDTFRPIGGISGLVLAHGPGGYMGEVVLLRGLLVDHEGGKLV